jgi:RNA polymerase sigma-70 factor (ECF subfamily)
MTNEELLERFYETGDTQWLGILLEGYTLVLYGYCLNILHNKELAKEAVQQIHISVIRSAGNQKIRSFVAWLITIAKNECAVQYRKQQRLLRDVIETDTEKIADPAEAYTEERADLAQRLPGALDLISEPQRDCILLFYIYQLSYQQISDKTGLSLNEVKTHIQNGKRNLRKILERYEPR